MLAVSFSFLPSQAFTDEAEDESQIRENVGTIAAHSFQAKVVAKTEQCIPVEGGPHVNWCRGDAAVAHVLEGFANLRTGDQRPGVLIYDDFSSITLEWDYADFILKT